MSWFANFWVSSINHNLQLKEQKYQVTINTMNNGHADYPKKNTSRREVITYLKNKGIAFKE
jgi:hypothetical protein